MQYPKLKDLITAAKKCFEDYEKKRVEFDSQRFLGSIRPATNNAKRINDAKFIVNLAEWVDINRESLKNALEHKNYEKETAPFIKQAITGAFILELSSIIATYGNEKRACENSALAKTICGVYGIEKLSDIESDEQKLCLKCFSTLMDYMRKNHRHVVLHEDKTHEALIAMADKQMEKIDEAQSVSSMVI